MGDRHQDRHVVVTGAGTGIGRAIALRLAAEGARLSLLARDVGRLEATLREAAGSGHRAAACDVRDEDAVRGAFQAAAESQGAIHAVVANAGIGGPNEAAPGGDRFGDLVATNLGGTYACFRAGLEHIAPGPEVRHLLAVSSILARIGVAGYTGYCASKAGILGLVRALAAEVAGDGVQVNAVCPGWVDTEMAREGLAGMAEGMGISLEEAHGVAMEAVPAGRMSQPDEVAGLVSYLVSADARGITGQGVDMNGGAFMS